MSRNYVSSDSEIGVYTPAMKSELEKVSTIMVLGVLRKMFEAEAESRDIRLRFFTADHLMLVDPLAMMRIMSNLISNALNHSNGSKILIGFRCKGGSLIFQVHDNGLGISQVKKTRLMYWGEKGKESTGDGLGLNIAQELCEAQGMQFDLCSQQGAGTSVFVVMKKSTDVQ